ncbi:MAG: hypothetical protein ABJH63_02100 [Rhizobiaceae bacterium]
MSGFFAVVHVLRLVLEMLQKLAERAKVQDIRRKTVDAIRLKARLLSDKADAARRRVLGSHRGNGDSERLHDDDGYRRD